MNSRTAALALALVAAVAVPATATASVRVSAQPIASPLSTKTTRTSVVVENTGKRTVRELTLTVSAAKGVKVSPTRRKLKPLRPGRTARVGVSVRRTRTGPSRGRLTVKLRRRSRTVATARLPFGAGLAGRYFWGSTYTINGIDQHTLYFTGPDLVYTAATENGWPRCEAVSETCKPYTYDGKRLTVDGKPATLKGRKLELDDDTYFELGFPPAGVRWDTVITYSNSSGVCPLYCNYYTENLMFAPDGRFVRDAVASGTGPIVDWGVVPPDRKGTYEVRSDRTLRLAYADGTERIETVGLFLDDDGTLKPPGEGVILGGDGYFDIRD